MTKKELQHKVPDSVYKELTEKTLRLAEILGETKFYPYQEAFGKRVIKSLLTNEGSTITALFSRQCIAEGTPVISSDGEIQPIEKSPHSWQTSEATETIEIAVETGSKLVCTPNHPVYTRNGWTEAGNLRVNDDVAVLKSWNTFGSGVIPYVLDGQNYTFTMTDELAEFLGYLIFSLENRTIVITKNPPRVKALMEKYFPGYTLGGQVWRKNIKNRLTILVDGRLKTFLTNIMRIDRYGFPHNLHYFTRSQVEAFLNPIFTHYTRIRVYNGIRIEIRTRKNREFSEYFRLFLLKLGIYSTVLPPNNCTNYIVRIASWKNVEKINEYFKLPKLPKLCKSIAYEEYQETSGETLWWRRIHSIKSAGLRPVWDKEVAEKGWFIADGIKVHNSGKSQTVAMVTAALLLVLPMLVNKYPEELFIFKKGLWVGVFAPINEQAVTLFDRIYDILTTDTGKEIITGEFRMSVPTRGGKQGNVIRIDNGSIVRMHSAAPRSKIESKTYHLILLDECQDVTSFKISKSISPMGAAVNATTVATGTPDIYIGWFYNMIEYNKKHDVTVRQDDRLHYESDYTVAQKYNPFYKKYIEKEKRRIGEDSDEFRMAYRLIWPITRGMMFTKQELESKCYVKNIKIVDTYKENPCIAGLDLGKSVDSTVLTILSPDWNNPDENGNMPKQLLDWLEIVGDEWEEQYEQLVDKLSNYWIDTLVVDATGVGDPITERLNILLPTINVIPFVFSPSTKDLGYKYLLQEIKNGRILIPGDSKTRNLVRFKRFENQMLTLKKAYSGKFLNPSCVEDKGHDDYPSSIMLATYGTYYEAMPEISVYDNDFFKSDRVNYDLFGRNYARVRR